MLTILFVCVHNSGHSQITEALFNQFVKGRIKAVSAGTQPAKDVEPVVAEAMHGVGIDISHQKPKKLTTKMIEQANKVITMDYGVDEVCPATFVETEDWNLDDLKGKPIKKAGEIRDQIQAKVWELLEKTAEDG